MQFIKKHLKSEFLRNVLTLFSGASVAQLIPILVSPILSRMYAPEQFGQLGVLMSVVGIFSIIATFQYESAIMLPKKDEDAFNILVLAVVITVFISILSYAVTSIFNIQIANLLKSDSFSDWVFIIPIFVLLTGLFNSLNIWASRQKQFKRLAFRQIAQTTVGAGTKLVLGWMKYLNSGLIWGTLAGQVTSTGVLTVMTIKDSKKLFSSISIQRIKENAIEYQDFPKYTMWQGFFDLLNASGIIFILSSFYGVAVVGLYTFTIGLLQKPTRMIGQAVSQVFYQNASKKVANGESIYKDTLRLVKNLALVGAVVFIPFLLFGPYLFSFVFGNKWWDAGAIAQILSVILVSRFILAPLANITMMLGKNKENLLFTGINNIIVFSIFLLSSYGENKINITLMIVALYSITYFVIRLAWILNIIKRNKYVAN